MNSQTPEDNAVAIRARLRATRAALPATVRDRGALLMRARLFAWLGTARDAATKAGQPAPTCVAAFWPMADEPDLLALLTQWADGDVTVALPVIEAAAQPLAFKQWSPDIPMTPGLYGIPAPHDGAVCQPDVILVPTLGFTARGDRLGYGGGYYDRTLATLRAAGRTPITIGIAWSEGRLPADYQAAAHDQRLDAILTPDGWVPAAPGEAADGKARIPAPPARFTLR